MHIAFKFNLKLSQFTLALREEEVYNDQYYSFTMFYSQLNMLCADAKASKMAESHIVIEGCHRDIQCFFCISESVCGMNPKVKICVHD